jgi:nucleoside-diphosphate-sugar epimerase
MKRCCITGGAGFICSDLAHRLLANDWEITVFCDIPASSKIGAADQTDVRGPWKTT